MTFLKKYIGDKKFYRILIILVLPIVIQQGITNFVSLLDNLMVGRLGTLQMSGVSIVNQIIFVFNLLIFGGLSGASIYGTQFFGVGDNKGVRDTFRFKLYFSVVAAIISVAVFAVWGEDLIMLFLKSEENTPAEIAETLGYAKDYLMIAIVGLIPFAIVQAYSGTLRESGETVAPMVAGCIAIGVNLAFNYILIFGKFGFPALGVAGAAIATVMSRFVELIYLVIWSHRRALRFEFFRGVYKSFKIPAQLVWKMTLTGAPLMINEAFWSLGMTFINQSYSSRGIAIIAATNISTTAWNLFCVVMMSMGTAISIMVGQKLGSNDTEGAVDVDRKLIFFTFAFHILVGLLIIASAPFIPLLYNVEPEAQAYATKFLMISGASLPIHALVHAIYFTVRAGGRTIVTFLFDSVYTWAIPAMIALFLCRFTAMPIVWIFFIVQFSDIIKLAIGLPMLKPSFWTRCVITDVTTKKE